LGGILADLLGDAERLRRLEGAARPHIRSLLLDPPDRMDQEIGILLQVIDESAGRRKAVSDGDSGAEAGIGR
jgi:hypothetical protein